ncbi:MAG: YitT family protein [Fretibacterium sp.]|nr:YitT family protein [Fretibacterium sp.]
MTGLKKAFLFWGKVGLRWIRDEAETLFSVTVGTAIVCFALVALTLPYQFAGAGVTGLALITHYAWGLSPVWVITLGNALLLLWGWRFLSARFAFWTLVSSVLTSVMVPIFERFQYPVIGNSMLAALLCGLVGGLGFGLLFRVGASSGGTDVLVMAARKRWGVDVGSMSFYLNSVILFGSLLIVSLDQVLMGGLVLYIETTVIDNVVRSFDRRTQVLAISKRHEEIIRFVTETLDRSATLLPATGAYEGRQFPMVLVVLPRPQAVELKRFIAVLDPSAFVIFSDVSEVVGEGFKKWGHA